MARVDFFVDKISQTIYINELNTIPGFTHVSMYPMMWQASGLDFSDLITALVNLARLRYQRQMNLNIANG
jgi:D-alanine-D-alanine ligase